MGMVKLRISLCFSRQRQLKLQFYSTKILQATVSQVCRINSGVTDGYDANS